MGEKQKRPNKGPFFVTHRIERVKRGGGKGHIYFRGCGSSILRTLLRRITHKKCYLLSPHKSDKQSHQYKVDYNIKCSVVPPTYSWQILNNDKSLYLNRYPWPKMFLCNRFLKLCDIISYMKCNNFFASKSHHHILAKNLLWKRVPTLACCNH